MNRTLLIVVTMFLLSCSDKKITIVIENKNDTHLEGVFVMSNTIDWVSDTIIVAANSNASIHRTITTEEFHDSYSIGFEGSDKPYEYGLFTTTLPTTETILFSFHGDTVRVDSFHVL